MFVLGWIVEEEEEKEGRRGEEGRTKGRGGKEGREEGGEEGGTYSNIITSRKCSFAMGMIITARSSIVYL